MRALAWTTMALLLCACARPRPGDLPAVRYGSDPCARCGMIVSEERFASGYVDEQGKSVVFDDVGEFLRAAAERPEIVPFSFVHDAETGRWLKAAEARYVQAPGLATPMGSGLAAFSTENQAMAYARRLGGAVKVLTFSQAAGNEKSGS